MQNKLTFNKYLILSGENLLLGLGLGLSSFALIIDNIANRVFSIVSLSFPLILCGLVTVSLGYWVIPILRKLRAGQIIREDGPKAHLQKAGTPTMGGIFFVPVGVAIALVLSRFHPNVIGVSLLTLGYSLIGLLDDWQILQRNSNKGISPKMKLALQIGVAILFCGWLAWSQTSTISNIVLPFGLQLSLGLLFWPLAGFVLVAESNATNLTDGVDGLMGGLGAIAFFGLGAYLAPTSLELMIFCGCMSGSCLGFVAHNRNPARVFMGDTGSLALGGGLAAVALVSNTLWVLLIISGIFLIETLSVIAQVSYYKATKRPDGVGKRLFKMAPFHHHLELSGWLETQVVGTFYLVGSILVSFCLLN
ncbi:MAG: phospho-N-acetylmuramoyl-pentapeptide-transferase [Trichodesmium sp. MAG_R03]|jgi:phospho-N-acetylmuramoyl-pentapeptide-transferase|nr:phospho-N-acetylmuramoyl-pentapeptide-transferase [Trichodesmium sp. MAG_R03]